MNINKKIFLILSIVCFVFWNEPVKANDATIYLSPITSQYQASSTIPIKLWLKVGNYPIDKIEIAGSFPEDFLELKKMDVLNYVETNSSTRFNNERGTFTINGTIEGGLSEDTVVATLYFTIKHNGSAALSLYPTTQVFVNGQPYPTKLSPSMYYLKESDGTTSAEQNKETEEEILSEDNTDDPIFNISTSSILKGEQPTINGTTKNPGARIEINLDGGLVTDRVFANGAGEWSWTLPPSLLPGTYAVKISVLDAFTQKIRQSDWIEAEVVKMDVSKTLFKLTLDSTSNKAYLGKNYNFTLGLMNLGNQDISENQYTVEYYIEDPNYSTIGEDEIILDKEVFEDDKEIKLNVAIPKDSPIGEYSIYAKLKMGQEEVDSQMINFSVAKEKNYLLIVFGVTIILMIAWIVLKPTGKSTLVK